MRLAWIQWSAAAATAALALLLGEPLGAADATGVATVAEDLGNRVKTPEASEGAPKGGLSERAVRMMSTYALSILPEEYKDDTGAKVKLDKTNPNKYLIPVEDARRVIRVAMRSAYAVACNLVDLGKANFETLMQGEEASKVWSKEQLLFINSLHVFSASYLAGNVTITTEPVNGEAEPPAEASAQGSADSAAANASESAATTITPKKLECSPAQREKVAQSIGAYVQSAKASRPAPQASTPAPQTSTPAQAAGAN